MDRQVRLGNRHRHMTLGLTSALWRTGVVEHQPAIDHWLIPHPRWRPVWLPSHSQVHLSRHANEPCLIERFDKVTLRVSTPLRAMLDCIRFRELLGRDIVLDALRGFSARSDLGLQALRVYARREKLLKPLLSLFDELYPRRVPLRSRGVTSAEPCPPASPSSPPPALRSPVP
ncbi:MAG: hypothetical protein JNK82_14125 [Myxococcaceae bacterium]|nr:hypothetical protein [Myxococcaceae bacterium]